MRHIVSETFVFLQMLLPSENYTLWNNRGALWTMSAFALFYLLAPWQHRLLRGFWPSMAALAALLVCKGMLGGWIESAMAGFPPQAMADQFAAKTPLMVLHCFLFGTTLRCALREEKTLWYIKHVYLKNKGRFGGSGSTYVSPERGVPTQK